MEYSEEELKIIEESTNWVKKNQKKIIERFAKDAEYVEETVPITLFMAGSPGAGKTEISKRLIQRFNQKPIRIDADEIRSLCDGYIGINAHLFQKAANKGVNILYDYALQHKHNVILDGTFAYAGVVENIQRSLDKGRKVEIFFVYQDPLQAWDFTKKREEIEKRRVSKEVFINAFFKSQENVNKVKACFGSLIELNIIIKDFEKDLERLEINAPKIDNFIKTVYTVDSLNNQLL